MWLFIGWTLHRVLSLTVYTIRLEYYWCCHIVCRAGSMERSDVSPSVRPSVPSINSSNGGRRVCCWALCVQEISIDSCGCAVGAVLQQMRVASSRACAHRGKWGQLTPSKNEWKIKKRKHAKKDQFSMFMLYFESNRAGRCRERRYSHHIFIQIYFRMHHFVVKFFKFSSPQAARRHWPPNQNPADVLGRRAREG